ncbi:RNA recognition motif 2-domain-containing protein [Echria macrotheca]|uniref:RNA recognition motif 2-domain-containing protein n=1 Tax=Echria macrotheca TaxID=438768 RepID=A0AAJ0BDX5_9PEZI|nr:RNA recognition motif 2-domain-containing protein [Echria macrotheca]
MAQAKETSFNPSSPHSSSAGGDSYKHEGTPDTRLTAFSPEESSARSAKLMKNLGLATSSESKASTANAKSGDGFNGNQNASEKDPFISASTTAAKVEQKLSPTASAFRPLTIPMVAHGSLNAQANNGVNSSSALQSTSYPAASGFSSELGISRYIALSSSDKPVATGDVENYLMGLEQQLNFAYSGKCSLVPSGGKVYIRATNVQYARAVRESIGYSVGGWRADYISASEFYNIVNPGGYFEVAPEGQVQIWVQGGDASTMSPAEVEELVLKLLQKEGDVVAFRRQSEQGTYPFKALVEFADLDIAVSAISKYNGARMPGFQLWVSRPEPNVMTPVRNSGQSSSKTPVQDMTNMFQGMNMSGTPQPSTGGSIGRHLQSPLGPHMSQQPVMYQPVLYQSPYVLDQTPTRRHSGAPVAPMTPIPGGMPMMGPIFTPPSTPLTLTSDYTSPRGMMGYGRQDNRRQYATRVNRSPYHVSGSHHNQVDVNRIRDGIDVRTTIMLRNIPNKVNQAMLKDIVDQSSWGKYDFMYLRIDFANDCNVGYAFINFVDPLHIIDFVNARANQRWNCFKSDKVAEVSYATIQGKDCLVQKFRNSSVMLEAPHYRPKLYYTCNGPMPELAGQEEPFPEPDNQSKMKRSCENAEHVGLFTPNAGQHFRDEQRRRRSQYDRGTRLAALEEYDYDAQIQQQSPFMPLGH